MKHFSPRSPQFASFLLFIALCMSLAYWVLQATKPPMRAVAALGPKGAPPLAMDAAAALFGGSAAAASNYQLKGIVADNQGQRSAAILSVDGKPAVALGVGGVLAPGVTVEEIFTRHVVLRDGGLQKRLDLPDLPPVQNNVANMGANMPTPSPGVQMAAPAQVIAPPATPATPPPAAATVNVPTASPPLPRTGTTTVTPTPPGR
jgi:general secretion pathway protein C